MEDYKKLRKWRHYAAHDKKFRTRKKYKRKLKKHFRLVLCYTPPKILTPIFKPIYGCWWCGPQCPSPPLGYGNRSEFIPSETELAGMKMREEARK